MYSVKRVLPFSSNSHLMPVVGELGVDASNFSNVAVVSRDDPCDQHLGTGKRALRCRSRLDVAEHGHVKAGVRGIPLRKEGIDLEMD